MDINIIDDELLQKLIELNNDAWETFHQHPKLGRMLYYKIQFFLNKKGLAYTLGDVNDLYLDFLAKLMRHDCHVLRTYHGKANSQTEKTTGRKKCSLHTYLYAVLANWLRDQIRLKRLVSTMHEASLDAPVSSSPEENRTLKDIYADPHDIGTEQHTEYKQFSVRLYKAVDALEANERMACTLFLTGGVRFADIAQTLKIPDIKIYQLINSARQKIAENLRQYYTDSEIAHFLRLG